MDNFYDSVYFHDQQVEDKPHGWIQWKGTEVCMDIHCSCGHFGHMDASFFYFYKCSKCHAKYAVGQNVLLIPLTPEQVEHVEREENGFKTDVLGDD